MHRLTRREFFQVGAGAGLAAGLGHILPGCGPLPATLWPARPPVQPTDEPARVVAVRGQDLGAMVRAALAAVGGAGAIVRSGEMVFLKPNLVGAGLVHHELFSTGECTKPELIVAVAEECLKAGAAQVIIGDGAQVHRFAWENLYTLDGATNLAAEAERLNALYDGEVVLACLDADSPAWDVVRSPYSGFGELYVSSLVMRADRIISLPVLKTHRITQLTLSLKNFIGVTSGEYYGVPGIPYRVGLHNAPSGIESCFLDIVAGLEPDFTLIDASIGCEGNGPHVLPGAWGTTVDLRDRLGDWLVLASDDLVAADATAARIVGLDPASVQHIALAYDRGLGQIQEDRIELDGATLDELRVDWQPAEPVEGLGDVLWPGLAMAAEH